MHLDPHVWFPNSSLWPTLLSCLVDVNKYIHIAPGSMFFPPHAVSVHLCPPPSTGRENETGTIHFIATAPVRRPRQGHTPPGTAVCNQCAAQNSNNMGCRLPPHLDTRHCANLQYISRLSGGQAPTKRMWLVCMPWGPCVTARVSECRTPTFLHSLPVGPYHFNSCISWHVKFTCASSSLEPCAQPSIMLQPLWQAGGLQLQCTGHRAIHDAPAATKRWAHNIPAPEIVVPDLYSSLQLCYLLRL